MAWEPKTEEELKAFRKLVKLRKQLDEWRENERIAQQKKKNMLAYIRAHRAYMQQRFRGS